MTVEDIKNISYEIIHFIYSRNGDSVISSRSFSHTYSEKEILSAVDHVAPISDYPVKYELKDSYLWELQGPGNVIKGVVTDRCIGDDFDRWFIKLLLTNSNLFHIPESFNTEMKHLDEDIANIFTELLKYTTDGDQWNAGGKDLFKRTVRSFIARNETIEAVLPAFPCKSSNGDKVVNWMPDKGEELALSRLVNFTKAVKMVYPPGIIVWIVSDGHVFSDCINVDDDTVDAYSEELQKLYERNKPKGEDCIRFCALKDIFECDDLDITKEYLKDFHVDYHLNTKIDAKTEIYRKLMIKCCDVDSHKLYDDIKTPGHPRLKLYRGFMKFMENDLYNTAEAKELSRKKYKKLVSKIAFEMIKRNDAYSNLVELFFPFHLRLSIHAHNNSGPKFAVRLLPKDSCQTIEAFGLQSNIDEGGVCVDDYLHVPTPWHNAVLKLEESNSYVIGKSGSIRKVLEKEGYSGLWDDLDRCFQLQLKLTDN